MQHNNQYTTEYAMQATSHQGREGQDQDQTFIVLV